MTVEKSCGNCAREFCAYHSTEVCVNWVEDPYKKIARLEMEQKNLIRHYTDETDALKAEVKRLIDAQRARADKAERKLEELKEKARRLHESYKLVDRKYINSDSSSLLYLLLGEDQDEEQTE